MDQQIVDDGMTITGGTISLLMVRPIIACRTGKLLTVGLFALVDRL
jgi:hypothetical protein